MPISRVHNFGFDQQNHGRNWSHPFFGTSNHFKPSPASFDGINVNLCKKKQQTSRLPEHARPTTCSFPQAGLGAPLQHIRNGTPQIHHLIVRALAAHSRHLWGSLGEAEKVGELHGVPRGLIDGAEVDDLVPLQPHLGQNSKGAGKFKAPFSFQPLFGAKNWCIP